MYDTIIIGAGMSGLAAGIRLAYFEQRVCIVERHYTIGGLNSFYRLRGRDYDVGLHAVTNYSPKGTRKGPLARILRQLRIRWDDFALSPQRHSEVAFPQVRLEFDNDIERLESSIAEAFPGEVDGFRSLCDAILDYDELDDLERFSLSTREQLEAFIREPMLREMLLCPTMWYGNAREHDMDFGQFSIMFRAIFLEGFARPLAGVRLILKHLVRKYRSLGGELKLRSGVRRIIVEDGRATGVEIENGEVLTAKRILSSAGLVETLRLCDDQTREAVPSPGEMSFTEVVSVLDCQPTQLGHDATIVFFNDAPEFRWERPRGEWCDLSTGVICSPNNFDYEEQAILDDGIIRVTSPADYAQWQDIPESEYAMAKRRWQGRILEAAAKFVPDFRHRMIDADMFTPSTIRRFTWHEHGAVYGSPEKRLDGKTRLPNLFLCGNDQGFVGIVGAMVSGLSIANRYCLNEPGSGTVAST